MTAENTAPGDLALAPLVTCKLCLCEQSLDKMTTLQECQCIFCTACLKQYMQLAIREGCGSPITCPDMVCLNHGTLQEAEIACLVPVDQFQLYQRLKFERENQVRQSRLCPQSMSGSFGVNGEELTHHHVIIRRIPLDHSTSSQIQGARRNIRCNKGVVTAGNTPDN
ncbi:hypothetical protein CB1_002763002 [Camelus ferus]|nr:hypothetical protein CB1_002763002 [Camelus ferus]